MNATLLINKYACAVSSSDNSATALLITFFVSSSCAASRKYNFTIEATNACGTSAETYYVETLAKSDGLIAAGYECKFLFVSHLNFSRKSQRI